ncbi:putative ribosome-binding factor A, mitochondrial isoform X2 [Panthera uncia]|uniref:putative ribosome-binding factor A, mitochondrial isoform X2 n=2 Tax=Panthera TaxID=9688 RepID=UPI0020FF7DE9|nr:putative ribosome-binding factor A, mitochondrial isoform X2 [Panthera uncia]
MWQEPTQEVCFENQVMRTESGKKFWYEGPSLGSHLMYKPSQLGFLTKTTSKKTRKDDQVRLRALNGLLYKALTDLLCTPEVSQEICDLNVQLSKVSLTSDFSACRVYWRTTVSAEQNAHTEAVLRRSAAHMRHILMSQQTLRNVPPIVFLQDKGNAALAEVDWLLANADFGPPEEREDRVQSDARGCGALDAPSRSTQGPAACSSLCGIDHEALNRQIMEYKRRKERGCRSESPAESPLTHTREGNVAATPCADGDLSRENHLSRAASGYPDPDLDGSRGAAGRAEVTEGRRGGGV